MLLTHARNLRYTILASLNGLFNQLNLCATRLQVLYFFVNYLVHDIKLELSDRLNKSELMIVRYHDSVHRLILSPQTLQLQKQLLRSHNVRLNIGDAWANAPPRQRDGDDAVVALRRHRSI